MKKIVLALAVALTGMMVVSCDKASNGEMTPGSNVKTFEDSLSYYFGAANGAQIAEMMKAQMPEEDYAKLDKDAFLKGLKTAVTADTASTSYVDGLQMGLRLYGFLQQMHASGINVNTDMLYSAFAQSFKADSITNMAQISEELNKIMSRANDRVIAAQQEAQRKAMEEMQAKAAENAAKGEAYIAEVKAKDADVKTTESGLTYKVVKQGTGALPTEDAKVKVIYTGRLIDGTEFDSSNGEPVSFGVNQVIPGFKEGLMMMNPGSKYVLYIPGNLAYGENAPGGKIGPNETLVFDVEVVGFE